MWKIGNQQIQIGVGFIPNMPLPELRELVRRMDAAGYDQIWCGNEKLYRDMWVTMGLVAAQTERLQIGTFIADPYSYHPALIAAAIATVAEANCGQAILVLGAGGFSFRELGIDRKKPLSALSESILVIRDLLAGRVSTMQGQVVTTQEAKLLFAPLAGIPIWIASRGNKILEMAGRLADGVMIATYAQPQSLSFARNIVKKGCWEAGRHMDEMAVTVRVDFSLDADRERARAAVKPMIAGMVHASYPDQAFVEQAGLTIPVKLGTFMGTATFAEVYAAAHDLLPERFVDAFSWSGTPADVAGMVASVIEAGFTRICLVPHPPKGRTSLDMILGFAEQVMPHVKALLG
ncbi:MAG: LLM class flavin-dependent oxidoreductase [Anaerolineales bacterium]|nr:LLM class flavin-dependent oxidoreductase [Anaerolineales bacterium]